MVRVSLPSIETEPILDSTDQFSSIEVPHCLLICGPHTSEKKSLMRALAGEANVPGFCISGRELNDVPVIGWTDEVVSELLAQAKKAAPCIIFVDNIDDGLDESARRRLIKLMDGVRVKGSKVILVANTSIPGALDLTLTRRFDCCIKF
jgi:cell division protease FtsH